MLVKRKEEGAVKLGEKMNRMEGVMKELEER